jgi:hypothetical protein
MLDNSHSVMSEGIDVGVIGALAVAIWFLILDTIAGHPFLTPSLLGQVVLFGDSSPDTSRVVFGAILVYTAFHFAIFALVGMGLVALVHWGERTNELFPFWAVLVANTLAAVCMGAYLWVRHPRFRECIRETPLGDAPQ